MFGSSSERNSSHGNGNDASRSSSDFGILADHAYRQGNLDEATHLYLLAFDGASKVSDGPDAAGVEYLRKAWGAAIEMKDRSLAEYIFEKLEPYCSPNEVAHYAEKLQRLALDRLEEFGISSEDLQEMADMVAEDFFDGADVQIAPNMLITQHLVSGGAFTDKDKAANPRTIAPMSLTSEGESKPATLSRAESAMAEATGELAEAPEPGQPGGNGIAFAYRDLVGYGRAIDEMHNRGIGLSGDVRFNEFLSMLSRRHGIDGIPAHHTLLFRAYSREDANRFMAATVGEMGLPTVRMYMEDTPHGFPVLCVTASPNIKPRNYFAHSGFDGPGVLVLEDIDLWGAPLAGALDDFDPMMFAQLSRGAREAIMLIRAAVENSEVTVLATCASESQLDDFFLELLDPIFPMDIDVPDETERAEVWKHAATLYPSLRFIDRADLVRLSRNMSREDIYLAARESVEQAYRQSVEKRSFVPVTRDNIFDKVAAYQPLDSDEYKELEEAAVRSWRTTLDKLEDFINNEEGD